MIYLMTEDEKNQYHLDRMREYTSAPWKFEEDMIPYIRKYEETGDDTTILDMFVDHMIGELEFFGCPPYLVDQFAESLAEEYFEYLLHEYGTTS